MRSWRNALFVMLFAGSLLSSCATAPTATPRASAEYVGVAPAFAELAYDWLADYADQDPLHELTLQVLPAEDGLAGVESDELAFLVSSAEPPATWFATPLARVAILIAVSPDVTARGLDLDELKDVYAGRIHDWSEIGGQPGPITPIAYPAGDEIRQAFQEQVLGTSRMTSNALLAPDPAATAELLAKRSGAIGFLPGHALPASFKPLALAGIAPSLGNVEASRYPLTIEILALAPEEPLGLARAWLGWIQAQATSELP